MLSKNLLSELNLQLKYEFYSSHLYLAYAGLAYDLDLDGFANFFTIQAEEERAHAMKFFHFIQEMDGKLDLHELEKPEVALDSILEVMEASLKHEQFVTSRIYKLMDIALDEREHATKSFLQWFIDEQVEEEATFKNIVSKLKRAENNNTLLYNIDAQMAARVYTAPE